MKSIIVLVGEIASGKGTVSDYLTEKYHASYHRFSSMLKDLATRLYLPISRDTLIRMSEVIRGGFGEDTMAKVIACDVEKDTSDVIVVDGARRMADLEHLSKLHGFHLVYVTATLEMRFERIKNRGEKVGEKDLTFEQFKADNERSTEVSIQEVAEHAEFRIDNNGSVEELYAQIDTMISSVSSRA